MNHDFRGGQTRFYYKVIYWLVYILSLDIKIIFIIPILIFCFFLSVIFDRDV